jgi:hypothetical protein
MLGVACPPGNKDVLYVGTVSTVQIKRRGEMKKWLILGMVLVIMGLLLVGCEKAMKGTGVYGKVIDKETKKPVEGATITITALRQVSEASPTVWAVTATTDSSGNYSLKELEPGNYAVTLTSRGYFAYSLSELVVKKEKMKRVDIQLEASFVGG